MSNFMSGIATASVAWFIVLASIENWWPRIGDWFNSAWDWTFASAAPVIGVIVIVVGAIAGIIWLIKEVSSNARS